MKRIYRFIINKLYILRNTKRNVRFLNNVKIDSKCKFEGYNSIGENNSLRNCYLGLGSYTGHDVKLNSVKIGRFCSIGSNISNITGNHPTSKFVSTHPAFYSLGKSAGFTFSDKQLFKELNYITENYLVEIGNDVWIGDNVVIFDNVKIGDGAIIGANCLVTKDIESYSINIGSPTKIFRYRFNPEIIKFLLEFKWWNMEYDWIKKNFHLFSDIQVFKQNFNENESL